MNHKQIKHITGKQYRELRKLGKRVAAGFDAEDIHQFRVAYKKLRAFFRMLSDQGETGVTIKITGKLKKAYNLLGAVRDLQLQQQRIREATEQDPRKPESCICLLQKEIDSLKPALLALVREKTVNRSRKRTGTSLPRKFRLPGFKLFLQKNWLAANAIIASRYFTDDHLHAIRKSLKDLFYNLELLDGSERAILLPCICKGKGEPYFYQLLAELGNFQDLCTAIDLLDASRLSRLDPAERGMAGQIKKSWIKNKRLMKHLLIRKLKALNTPQQAV